MEKIEVVYVPRDKHFFYCDRCRKEIMVSIEYDDGYYEEPHLEFKEYDDIIKNVIGKNIHLCKECKDYYEEYFKNKFIKEFEKVDKIIKGDGNDKIN